jgi:catechol 2,3-dioxygenase-like lactoylglutathione lyase family enzyme
VVVILQGCRPRWLPSIGISPVPTLICIPVASGSTLTAAGDAGAALAVLGFELVEDSPALTNDGRAKRWVVVRPPGAATGLLLARADGEDQAGVVGRQVAERVGFFLNVKDFGAAYTRMTSAGVRFLTAPRTEPYGQVVVFLDIAGNKWDLIGPAPN